VKNWTTLNTDGLKKNVNVLYIFIECEWIQLEGNSKHDMFSYFNLRQAVCMSYYLSNDIYSVNYVTH
jgi:hypothetical protein